MGTKVHGPGVLGRNVRAARERLGMSQAALAKAVGMSRDNIVRLETGSRAMNPSSRRLLAFAKALGVDVGALLQPGSQRAA